MFKGEKNPAVNHGKQVCGSRDFLTFAIRGKCRKTSILKSLLVLFSGYVSTLFVGVNKVKNTL